MMCNGKPSQSYFYQRWHALLKKILVIFFKPIHGKNNFIRGTRRSGHVNFWSFRIEHPKSQGPAAKVQVKHLKYCGALVDSVKVSNKALNHLWCVTRTSALFWIEGPKICSESEAPRFHSRNFLRVVRANQIFGTQQWKVILSYPPL